MSKKRKSDWRLLARLERQNPSRASRGLSFHKSALNGTTTITANEMVSDGLRLFRKVMELRKQEAEHELQTSTKYKRARRAEERRIRRHVAGQKVAHWRAAVS